MSVPTRRATPDDVPFLVDLRASMFAAMGLDVSGQDWRDACAGWFERALAVPDLVCVVVACDDEDRPVASAVGQLRDCAPSPLVPDGGDGLVHTVSTLEGWRGRGFGRACFESVMEWFRAEGAVRRIELFATQEGAPLYEAAGFAAVTWPAMRLDLPE